MTRVEDLTLKLIDGVLSDAEAEELRSLVDANPEAARVHVKLLEIEGGLRGERDNLDLSADVMERLHGLREQRIEKGVMSQIHSLPRRRTPRKPLGWTIGIAAAVAAAMLAVVFIDFSEPPKAAPDRIKITELPKPVPKPAPPVRAPETWKDPSLLPPPEPKPVLPLPPTPPRVVPEPVAPRPEPQPEKPPPPPAPEPPKLPPAVAQTVVAAVAEIESVTGEVRLVGAADPVRAPHNLAAGAGIETIGARSAAVVKFPDGTRMRIEENTRVRRIEEGKRILVDHGVVSADVAKQLPGKPVIFVTPQGEAKVLGTKLSLFVLPTWTRLVVEEGKVQLKNLAGKTVDVLSGHYAIAASGVQPVARVLPPAGAVVAFTLINADTQQPLPGFHPIPDNALINLAALPSRKLNIRAEVSSSAIGSIRFELDGDLKARVENTAPFELASETGQNPFSWPPPPGTHTLIATPFSGADAKGAPGGFLSLTFRVIDRK